MVRTMFLGVPAALARRRFVLVWLFLVFAACASAQTPAEEPAPSRILSRDNVEHYVWGEINDGWRFVDREDLSVIRERMSPGGKEVRHAHTIARQLFFVLEGEFTMEVNGDTHTIMPGEAIEIPPGAPHQAMNLSDADAEFIVVSQPTSKGDRVEHPE